MTPCPSREQLEQLLAEQLPEELRVLLEDHVEACSGCAAVLAGLSAPTETLDWRRLCSDRAVCPSDTDAAIARRLKENYPTGSALGRMLDMLEALSLGQCAGCYVEPDSWVRAVHDTPGSDVNRRELLQFCTDCL